MMAARSREGRSGRGAALLRWGPRALGIVLFAWLIVKVRPVAVWRGLQGADPWPILLSVVLGPLPFVLLKGWRWGEILRGLGLAAPPREAVRVYAIGLFTALVTPGQSGDFLKAWYLRARGLPLAGALLSCLVDRLFDFASLFALGALALLAYAGGGGSFVLVSVALVGVCLALAAVMTTGWRQPLFRLLGRLTPEGVRARLAGNATLRALAGLRLPARALVPILALNALAWAVSVGRVYFCFAAVGARLPAGDFLVATVLMTLAGLFSVSGIGTRDAFLLVFLSRYGYGAGQALAVSFLMLVLNISNVVPGFLVWLREPVPVRQERALDAEPAAGQA